MSTPTVSVIVITYNQEHCIDRALAGILHQKGPFNLQVIVANDASTDDTLTRAKWWKRKHPTEVEIIDHPQNIGFRANYLSAFRKATGTYIAMCDADDYWTDSSKLARQVAYMEAHPECAITFHRVINHYADTREKTLSNGGQRTDTDITHLSRSNFITNMSVLYRRALVPASELPEWLAEVSLPDYAYHMLYAAHGTIHYFARPMGVYTQSAAGAWSLNTRAQRLRMALNVRHKLLEYFPTDSPARPGLIDASVDILIALLLLTEAPKLRQEIINKIKTLKPTLTDHDINQMALNSSDAQMKHSAAVPRRLAKRLYRLITRYIPLPKPC